MRTPGGSLLTNVTISSINSTLGIMSQSIIDKIFVSNAPGKVIAVQNSNKIARIRKDRI